MNSASVGYGESFRSWRVLSTSAFVLGWITPSAVFDLYNSPYLTQAQSLIAK